MANLKALRIRINSVKATQKITRAMQMVAASKLRRAQEAAEQARPYAERMERMIGALAVSVAGQDDAPRLLTGTGGDDTHLIVVATGDRGLCGGFNSSIVRAARARVAALLDQGKTVKILCVGRKGETMLRRQHGGRIVDLMDMRGVRQVGFVEAQEVGQRVLDMFAEQAFDVCTVFFAHFRSVLVQEVTGQQLIPTPVRTDADEDATDLAGAIYDYEPDEAAILADLLPRNVTIQIFRALLENAASEQGARMTAMDNATRNAGDMIDRLSLTYNRARQAAITTELIEIISGAAAL